MQPRGQGGAWIRSHAALRRKDRRGCGRTSARSEEAEGGGSPVIVETIVEIYRNVQQQRVFASNLTGSQSQDGLGGRPGAFLSPRELVTAAVVTSGCVDRRGDGMSSSIASKRAPAFSHR